MVEALKKVHEIWGKLLIDLNIKYSSFVAIMSWPMFADRKALSVAVPPGKKVKGKPKRISHSNSQVGGGRTIFDFKSTWFPSWPFAALQVVGTQFDFAR